MTASPITDSVRRFLLTSSLTVPHVEAIVLLRGDRGSPWDAKRLGERLYVPERRAAQLLAELDAMHIVEPLPAETALFAYRPNDAVLASVLDELCEIYSKHVVDVSTLIHSMSDPVANQFAAAFRFRRDS